jgi:GNAT superfamily N-acetyltransferase
LPTSSSHSSPGAEVSDLLALYDHDERYSVTFPDLRREALPQVVRHVDVLARAGMVIYSDLTADTADAAIRQQMDFFQSLDQDFEWKAFGHDQPADLVQRLAAHGFAVDNTEAVLVLDLAQARAVASSHEVKRVQHPDDLRDVARIKQRIDGQNHQDRVDRLAYQMTHAPDYLSVYVAYVDASPAACAWIRFPADSVFASLWGGATIPELRGRGIYTALLQARLNEATQRHYRYVTVDAGPMSRPILEKHGFKLLTHATACTRSART